MVRGASGWLKWVYAVAAGLASGAAIGLMYWARLALQLRTLPERLMETFLLVIPPDQFEAAIEKFGPMAKDFALIGSYVVTFLVLVAVALVALRFVRPGATLLLLAPLLWFIAMAGIFPATGGGFFATALPLDPPVLTNTVYAGIGLAYASLLLAARVLAPSITAARGHPRLGPAQAGSRRAFLAGVSGAVAALIVSAWFGRSAGKVASDLPEASLPPPAAPASPAVPAGTVAVPPAVSPPAASSTAASGSPAASASAAASTASAPTAAGLATPTPASYPATPPERPLPRDKDGALLAVQRTPGQLQPEITPNANFYTVTKNAGGDPIISARDWRLIVDGAVQAPVQVDYLTLRRLPPVTFYKTLECISNLTAKCELTSFGCDLISTAKWTGARLSDVLQLAGGLKPGVQAIAAFGADEFSSSLPATAASDPTVILAYEMNDAVLPLEHGFPVRLIVPGHYGLKNAKWIVHLQPMSRPFVDWYGQRDWSRTALVNTMARIDEPANGATVLPGAQTIGGVAYAGDRGIARVEYSADGGRTWTAATLLQPVLGRDTFVRWQGTFQAHLGPPVTLVARATDGTGALQTETFNLPQPNGGTGWNSIQVKVAAS